MTSGNHLDIKQPLLVDKDNDTTAAFALHFVANGAIQIHGAFLQFKQR